MKMGTRVHHSTTSVVHKSPPTRVKSLIGTIDTRQWPHGFNRWNLGQTPPLYHTRLSRLYGVLVSGVGLLYHGKVMGCEATFLVKGGTTH